MTGDMDYGKLEQTFGIRFSQQEHAILTVNAADLLRADAMQQFLDEYAPLLKAHTMDAAGAIFGSTFGSFALGYQAAMSLYNQRLTVSPEQITLQLISMGTYYKIAFCLPEAVEAGPEGEARADWVQQSLASFYSQTILPLFRSIADISGIPIGHLWGQMPTYSNYYIDYLLGQLDDCSTKNRLADDYELLRQLDPAIMERPKNPFTVKPRWIEDLRDSNKQMRMKNVCCMYYKTGSNDYCFSCPKLKESDRAARREAAREAQLAAAAVAN